jgi:hypothetical protein
MTMCIGKSAARSDETYWDHNAAPPVLLIDEATEAITEALYHLRAGSVLDDRDLTAAGVALTDLFGGLNQLTDLLFSSAGRFVMTDPLGGSQLNDRLQGLQACPGDRRWAAAALSGQTD